MIYENKYMIYDSTTNVLNVKEGIAVFNSSINSTELHSSSNGETIELCDVYNYSVVIPNYTEMLADSAFSRSTMSEVNLPNGITSIGEDAFGYCTLLKSIIWPNETKVIKKYTFYNCVRLEEVTLPEGLTTICDHAFDSCKALKNITIPTTVQEFGNHVFDVCLSLETIEVPKSLYEKYNRVDYHFKGNLSAKVVVYDDSVVALSDEKDNFVDDKIRCSLEFEYPTLYKFSPEDLEDLCDNMVMRIKSNIIPKYEFRGLQNVSKLIIENPNNNSNNGLIGEFAFQECDDLKEAIISDSISKIDKYAFYFCRCLKEVHLSAGLKSIGERAFKSCCDLEEITIPSTVTKLGEGLFEDDSNIKKIIAPKHLIDKYGEEYVRGHCNAEVIAYEVDDSLNVNESLKTASSDNSTETVKSNSVQRRSFNGTIKTNIIASKKNK